jgi:multisubunit Na+/H+ antiporter MnhG subunit
MKQEIMAPAFLSPLNLAVAVAGVLIFALGVLGVVRPSSLTALVGRIWSSAPGAGLALVIRASLGFLLIAAASDTRFPKTIYALGVLSFIKAVTLLLLGRARQQNLMQWWCHHSARYIRNCSLLACGFGTFLIYAAVPARSSSTIASAILKRVQTSHEDHRDADYTRVCLSAILLKPVK